MTYVFLADGFEEVEALTVVDLLRRADVEVLTVSVNNTLEVIGAHDIKILCDISADEIELSDGVILPGGIPGVPNLGADERIISAINQHYDNKKLVAAICAAPTLLHEMGILNNVKATCYPSMLNKMVNAEAVEEDVVISGNIITSKGPGTAFDFAYEIISYLKDKESADAVKNSAYFK